LAQLFGIGTSSTSNGAAADGNHAIAGQSSGPSGSGGYPGGEEEEVLEDEEEDEGEDGDEEVEVDEDTLLWDAQASLPHTFPIRPLASAINMQYAKRIAG
jgi:hypothetical protein